MTAPLRVAVAGLVHDHVWNNLPHFRNHPQAELVAASDPHARLRERIASEYQCRTHESFDELLNAEEVDAVLVFGSNAGGAELAVQAADRGLHVLIEKPMAADLSGAEKMLRAASDNNVRLMINWPIAWWPQLQQAIEIAASGRIGDLWQVRYRAAHEGPQELGCSDEFCEWLFDPALNGGGALMDYCCYGVALARCLLGMPQQATGLTANLCKSHLPVEDNALIAMNYPHALAVAEASWTQIGKLTSYQTVIYGTRGTLLVEPGAEGRLLLATAEDPEGTVLDVPAPPPHLTDSASHFVERIRTGEPFHPLCQPDIGRDVQAILAAAMQSANNGHTAVDVQN